MLPSILKPLFEDVNSLTGVGDKMREALSRLGLNRVIDLIFHLPSNITNYQLNPDLTIVTPGSHIISTVTIDEVDAPPPSNLKGNRKLAFKIYCSNATGSLILTYFNYYPSYIIKDLKIGEKRIIAGKTEKYNGHLTIAHPDYIYHTNHLQKLPTCEAIYPLTYGIINKQLIKIIHHALNKLPKVSEWLPGNLAGHYNWPSFYEAIYQCHYPSNNNDLDPNNLAKIRLAFDELLASQLALNIVRLNSNKASREALHFSGNLYMKLLNQLPFKLTTQQTAALNQIFQDQRSSYRMMRMLQGDVGSGKTVVAIAAILNVVEAGFQGCIMAPTDILATQHYEWIKQVTSNLGIRIALLTGKIKGKKREAILERLKAGDIDIITGTHALFQQEVAFNSLKLIVIDEQHRFGVEQRLALSAKGAHPDMLVMSATPIPRSLTLALYGDMDIFTIKEKPAERLPIITSVMPAGKTDEVINSIHKLIDKGDKIYWICPLINEIEQDEDIFKKDLKAAINRFNDFRAIFGDKIGLIHGKMKATEKEQSMKDFASGHTQILVATTVIEVGIDVKDATVIIIEQAERFGLAQLHQLRGRVGRGPKQSHCILLYSFPISSVGKERLKIMRQSNDGFFIAEEDLRLRGSGDILGTKQSGIADFKFADLMVHKGLLKQAADLAKEIIEEDPKLLKNENQHLKELLYLFNYHNSLKYTTSG
jgi:ATP-dependent DNA helicase RecG